MTTQGSPTTERVIVVGTAGHVDHGKSTLVRGLTGTDPDRLEEEKSRGLTIELGFARFTLPGGPVVSLIDVPGHEDFIRTMIAGAGGMDAALLVVAADEGPMPQTEEHLAILDLLGLRHAVVVITKRDLVEDDWLALVGEELRERLAATALRQAPIVAVSAQTGEGLEELRAALAAIAAQIPPPRDVERPRLSADRVFTLSGFGTIVTGTLRDGAMETGESLIIQPTGLDARARGLQMHGAEVARALPGQRTAINLSGVDTDELQRGDVITRPDSLHPTRWVDVEARVLPGAELALEHDRELRVFHGANEILARARLLGGEAILPGERGWLQLRLRRPTVLVAGDRLVLRLPSPSRTIGGARVLDPRPRRRWRRFDERVVQRFAALASGEPLERAWYAVNARQPCRATDLEPADTGLEPAAREVALRSLADQGRIVALAGGPIWITDQGWERVARLLRRLLGRYHDRHPLRLGPPPEELRERLRLESAAFGVVLEQAEDEGWLRRTEGRPHLTEHEVRFDETTQHAVDQLLARFRAAPYAPPGATEAREAVGQEVLEALIARGELVAVTADVLFDRPGFDELRRWVVERIEQEGEVTVADLRDHFGSSRKYALGLLEHLDRIHLTRRVGDVRVLARGEAGA